MRIFHSPENGNRDIAVMFILVGLAALAVLSFIWAGIRISEIRAASSGPPSIVSP